MKTVISWIGFNEDFDTDGRQLQIQPSGFTITIQREIIEKYSFQKHIILYTGDRSNQITKEVFKKKGILGNYFKDHYPNHIVEFVDSAIDKSDLQNFSIIESALRNFLQSIDAGDELHVIAGTGPTAVGMAWCTLFLAMQNRFKLYVLQRPEYVPGETSSVLKSIEPFISKLLDDTLREHNLNINLPENIYTDELVKQEYQKAFVYAKAKDMNVLILGETGCGKDRMAEFIVKNSPLPQEKYRPINCASLSDDLLYSELFGHVKGAFTGAIHDRKGLFEECNGGTLFLDEIGDISKYMQQSLLRAIENKEIKKAGTNEVQKNIVVRIIAATNNDLYNKCKKGEFRWDLYYRLSNPEICLKNYRDRTLPERKKIIQHYKKLLEKKYGRKISFTKEALKIVEDYSFPGNFREIYNTINSLFPLDVSIIEPIHLPVRFTDKDSILDESYEAVLRKHCIAIYEKYNFNLAATCKALGYKNSTQLKNSLIKWQAFKDATNNKV